MRTAISVSVAILMFSPLVFNSGSVFHQTIEQSFSASENQEIIAKRNSKKPKGTPYRGSGRREFM